MNLPKRAAIIRGILGAGVFAAIGLLWPSLAALNLGEWLVYSTLTALIIATHLLGIESPFGALTFVPIASVMAYMLTGRDAALLISTAGMLLASITQIIIFNIKQSQKTLTWWQASSIPLFLIGQNGLSLLAADLSMAAFNYTAPLERISTIQDMMPIISALVIYLLVYNGILLIDVLLRKRTLLKHYRSNLQSILAIQILPMAIAPFAAIVSTRLGLASVVIFELILITISFVIRRLTFTQDRLQEQVGHLRTLSIINQAIRTSLDLEELLQTVYKQVTGLLKTRNLRIIFNKTSEQNGGMWLPQFIARDGKLAKLPHDAAIDGFSQMVLDTGTPLLAPSVEETAAELRITNAPRARSWMGIPLNSGRVQGCIVTWLDHNQQTHRVFTPTDQELLTTLTVQTEVAIENALLYEAAQTHAAQLARLNQISAVLNASLNPEQLLALVTESVIEVAGCDKAAIYLLEQNTADPQLRLTHIQGFSTAFDANGAQTFPRPLTDEEHSRLFTNGTALLVPDINAEGVQVSEGVKKLAQREQFTAYAYVPLRAQQRDIGLLAVYYNIRHRFTESERELLETFANQAALAVTNANIYHQVDIQLSRRVEQIVRMSEISSRLSATLDLQAIFNLIIESAIEGCKADAGVLVLAGDPELGYGTDENHPHMVAWRGFDPANARRAPHRIAEELANSDILEKGESRLEVSDDPHGKQPLSHMSVPIFLEGQVIGAIVLESDRPNAFNQDDLSFVGQMAVQAAVAIRNAQLYRHVQSVRDRLHAILDASNDGLLMIDARLRIVMTNTRMRDFWDFARSDFQSRTPDQFIADPLSSLGEGLGYKEGELNALIKRGISTPDIKAKTDLYTTRPTPGKRQRFVERTATPVRDERGGFIGLLLLFRDVTEQKELEEARQNLTNMIVHELRSPLQAVMGSMRLISEVTPEKDPVIDQATEVSQRAVKKLLNLVNNLLDLSRMEQGEFVLDPNIEKIDGILTDAADELMPLAQEMGAVVKVKAPEDLPYIQIDRDMIGRVVINLLDNALKYTNPGTLVTLGAKRFQFKKPEDKVDTKRLNAPKPADEMLCVWVADNGPGIPDEYKAAIFDRYSQIPGRKGRRRSAGLGLAFCKLAVDSHGGNIWVEDNPEGGSIFCFTLPLAQIPDQSKEKPFKPVIASSAVSPDDTKPGTGTVKQLPGDDKEKDSHTG